MTTARPSTVERRQDLLLFVLLAVLAAAALLAVPAAARAVMPTTSGTWSWAAPYAVTESGSSRCTLLAKAPAGDVYAVSELDPASGYPSIVIARLSAATGAASWTQSTSGPWSMGARAADVATDAKGSVIVAGWVSRGGVDVDCLVTKYDQTGTAKWAKTLDGGIGQYDDLGTVVTDAAGNVYVGGRVQRSTGTWMGDAVIVKYSPKGKRLWKYIYSSKKDDWVRDLAVDAKGNVYAACTVKAMKGAGASIMTISLNPGGAKRWSRLTSGLAADYSAGETMVVGGNVWVVGMHNWDGARPIVLKYRTSGKLAWSTGVFSWGTGWFNGFARDPAGRFCMSGISYRDFGSGSMSVGSLLAFDGRGAGDVRVDDDFYDDSAAPAMRPARFNDIVVDAMGRMYCAGSLSVDPSWGASLCTVVRHTVAAGAPGAYDEIWRLAAPGAGYCEFVTLLRVGSSIYAAGSRESAGTQQAVVDKLDAS